MKRRRLYKIIVRKTQEEIKGKDIDDLPILDLNHIFDQKESSPISNDSNLVIGDADTIPSYEDELRNKFGSGVETVGANINPLERTSPLIFQE